jgi:hypothetical protein
VLLPVFVLQITFTIDTCPFPAAEAFAATMISRNITIASLPAGIGSSSNSSSSGEALPGAAAAAGSATPPVGNSSSGQTFQINCNFLTDRFELQSGFQLTLSNIVLLNCRTYSYFGFLRKAAGSVVVYDRIVENFGSVCLPQPTAQGIIASAERPAGAPPLQQQLRQTAGDPTAGSSSSSGNGQQAVQLGSQGSN